jgi:hypothetical protein
MLTLLILLQTATTQQPDIQLDIRATARRVTIESSGEASLEVTGGPGSDVRVEAPDANGRRTLNNVNVRVSAEARVADPLNPSVTVEAEADQNPPAPETASPN